MKSKAEAHASSKQIDQTNKQLHTSLRRELERAKQVRPSQYWQTCTTVCTHAGTRSRELDDYIALSHT